MKHTLSGDCVLRVKDGLIHCEPHNVFVTEGMTDSEKRAMWGENWDAHRAHGLVDVAFRHILYVAARCSQHNVLCLDEEQ